ncbi:tRNA (adenosine(37)-N6)-threonylcarbamoyltransferase complex ATPase subunit type 1 TsaE [Candidatus Saccharibacteria bacterium]|nr:tRNA (adenosine(37)-N6)-threonylcarbamoyltransferase complex ATPase subunit type 1 TsaE [Candidatus Saccharibacteria bacterium]MBP5656453.1 tRNA (adenosine(37)-N6)-threonylcarbamoyltransferase complex ATPase subunit type 1 TsaE [Candidatus Saccharibacteria bacterium]
MLIHSESEMLAYGQKLGETLKAPAVLELLGDVGAGKTTLTRGIAKGLKVKAEVTSPSFTLSKEYVGDKYRLVHYDFYRLTDPGIMSEDLAETIADPRTITVIEWGQSIQDVLPEERKTIEIKYIDENTREVTEK